MDRQDQGITVVLVTDGRKGRSAVAVYADAASWVIDVPLQSLVDRIEFSLKDGAGATHLELLTEVRVRQSPYNECSSNVARLKSAAVSVDAYFFGQSCHGLFSEGM